MKLWPSLNIKTWPSYGVKAMYNIIGICWFYQSMANYGNGRLTRVAKFTGFTLYLSLSVFACLPISSVPFNPSVQLEPDSPIRRSVKLLLHPLSAENKTHEAFSHLSATFVWAGGQA
jgi:hypothetical protein